MIRISSAELEEAFRLFGLATEADRERLRALSTLGRLDELLNPGCRTQPEESQGEEDADLARVAPGRADTR